MHCLERGHLMGKIWWSEMELFQRLLQLREADAQIVQREREAYQAEADMLRQQVEEMQAAATPRPSPPPPTSCQKPWVTADAHARCAATDAGQARCAWATVALVVDKESWLHRAWWAVSLLFAAICVYLRRHQDILLVRHRCSSHVCLRSVSVFRFRKPGPDISLRIFPMIFPVSRRDY